MAELLDIESQNFVEGAEDRVWSVDHIEDQKYAVSDVDNDEDASLVDLDQNPKCEGTYYKYNPTCPHLQAVQDYLLLKNSQMVKQSDAVYEMDFDEKQLLITRSGDVYNIIFADGEVGYVNRRFQVAKNNIVCQNDKAKQKANSDDLYWYWDTGSVYDRHVDSSVRFEGYLHHNSNLDEDQAEELSIFLNQTRVICCYEATIR
jgi:hypothetical protein